MPTEESCARTAKLRRGSFLREAFTRFRDPAFVLQVEISTGWQCGGDLVGRPLGTEGDTQRQR